MPPEQTSNVFILYAPCPKDKKLKDELMTHLKGGIEIHHCNITWNEYATGIELEGETPRVDFLCQAHVIVLLLSANYLYNLKDNPHLMFEVKKAIEKYQRGTIGVIPVLLRECLWEEQTLFAGLEVYPQKNGRTMKPLGSCRSNKRDTRYKAVALHIKAEISRRRIKPDVADREVKS